MRIYQLTSATSPKSGDYIAIDNSSDGTRKTYARQVVKATGTISSATTTISNSAVTSTMEVIGYSLGTPSAITSAISWTTGSGSVTLTTTVASGGSSTITLYLSEVR